MNPFHAKSLFLHLLKEPENQRFLRDIQREHWNEISEDVQYEKCPNAEFFLVLFFLYPCIQSECGKTRTRKNAVFGHFSRSKYFIIVGFLLTFYVFPLISNMFFSIVVSFDFVKKVSRAETFNLTFFKSRMGL